jgi:hypothetical protein
MMTRLGMVYNEELVKSPPVNILVGTELLRNIHASLVERKLEKLKELDMTFAIYNGGEKFILEHWYSEGKLPEISRDYVAKIHMARKRWNTLGL